MDINYQKENLNEVLKNLKKLSGGMDTLEKPDNTVDKLDEGSSTENKNNIYSFTIGYFFFNLLTVIFYLSKRQQEDKNDGFTANFNTLIAVHSVLFVIIIVLFGFFIAKCTKNSNFYIDNSDPGYPLLMSLYVIIIALIAACIALVAKTEFECNLKTSYDEEEEEQNNNKICKRFYNMSKKQGKALRTSFMTFFSLQLVFTIAKLFFFRRTDGHLNTMNSYPQVLIRSKLIENYNNNLRRKLYDKINKDADDIKIFFKIIHDKISQTKNEVQNNKIISNLNILQNKINVTFGVIDNEKLKDYYKDIYESIKLLKDDVNLSTEMIAKINDHNFNEINFFIVKSESTDNKTIDKNLTRYLDDLEEKLIKIDALDKLIIGLADDRLKKCKQYDEVIFIGQNVSGDKVRKYIKNDNNIIKAYSFDEDNNLFIPKNKPDELIFEATIEEDQSENKKTFRGENMEIDKDDKIFLIKDFDKHLDQIAPISIKIELFYKKESNELTSKQNYESKENKFKIKGVDFYRFRPSKNTEVRNTVHTSEEYSSHQIV